MFPKVVRKFSLLPSWHWGLQYELTHSFNFVVYKGRFTMKLPPFQASQVALVVNYLPANT